MDRSTVLITGASSGIGLELARVFSAHGHDLILTARRVERLEALADSLSDRSRVHVIPLDLAKAKGPAKLCKALAADARSVDVLVNNAGIMATGPYQAMSASDARALLRLNVDALAALTQLLLPPMLERGRGRILNVSSVAGFQGLPGMALYSASKAFVLAFTEGLAEDLRGTGVTATALCPGPTRTEMTAGFDHLDPSGTLMASAAEVAEEGYRACMGGETVRVPGFMNLAMVNWMRMQPRWLVRRLSGLVSRSARS